MKLGILQRDLTKAEARVREGERHILHQREIVDELEAHGHDTAIARQLLGTFLELQVTHRADRDRIAKEIAVEEGAKLYRASRDH